LPIISLSFSVYPFRLLPLLILIFMPSFMFLIPSNFVFFALISSFCSILLSFYLSLFLLFTSVRFSLLLFYLLHIINLHPLLLYLLRLLKIASQPVASSHVAIGPSAFQRSAFLTAAGPNYKTFLGNLPSSIL